MALVTRHFMGVKWLCAWKVSMRSLMLAESAAILLLLGLLALCILSLSSTLG
jgi:hypothetical protein